MAYATPKRTRSTKASDTKPLPQKDKIFQYIEEKYQDALSDRTTWTTKQVKFNKLRMRVKKAKTFPFIGCSNLRMPTAEIKIRKTKAALYNSIFGIRPIVSCTPPPAGKYETALKIEKFLDHLIVERMKFKNKSIIAIDQELEQGFYLLMPYWKLEITKREETFDRADFTVDEVHFMYDGKTTPDMLREFFRGHFDIDMDDKISDDNQAAIDQMLERIHDEKPFSFYVQDIICDMPDVELIAPERCYVPATSGYDPQTNECSIVETFMPFHQLETNATYYGWDIDGVSEIGDYRGKNPKDSEFQREQNKDLLEGIDRLNSNSTLVRIWMYLGWYDLNGDGVKEKVIMYSAPDFNKTLKKMGLPFYNGKFNLIKLFYELTDNRWYAHRGIVELAEDIIKEIDMQHNMKIDQQTTRNAPMYLYRAGQVNPNLIQCIPNQAIPIRGLSPLRDTVDVLNNNNPGVEFSYEREEQILSSRLEEMFGTVDYTLQSQINKRQPRTLGEVQMQAQDASRVFALDVGMHVEQFTELFNFIWDLWCQYGPDEYEFNYFGTNGWEEIKLTKEEIQGQYKIVVRGNDQNTNPQVRLQKGQQIIQAAMNPEFVQMGVITPPQVINSLKRFYQYLDVENWEELVNLGWKPSPPAPPKMSEILKIDFESLTDAEKAQILQQIGIQPDVPGRQMQKREDLLAMLSEHGSTQNKGNGNGKPTP